MISFQPNQRIAVRGRHAWFRPNANSQPISFVRQDEREIAHIEGMDGWGSVVVHYRGSRSSWVDPVGRSFPSVEAAAQAWA